MKSISSFAILTSCIFFHLVVFGSDDKSGNYFPAGIGDSWTYKNSDKNFTWQIEVVGTEVINDKEYFIFKRSFENSTYSDSSYYRTDEEGKVFINYFDKDFLLIDFRFENGAVWQSYGAFKAQVAKRDEGVLTPAGNFTNCIEVLFEIQSTDRTERACKYAPGVGLVEYKTTAGVSKLTSANVNGVPYPGTDHFITSKSVE